MVQKREIISICVLMMVAIVRFLFFLPDKLPYDNAIGKKVTLQGTIIDTPDVRLHTMRVVVRPVHQESAVLVILPKESRVKYGDTVIVRGILEAPENFMTSSGKEFNYVAYLQHQDIYFLIKDAHVDSVWQGDKNPIKTFLYTLRDTFMDTIDSRISPPQSDLAKGLILGARGGFTTELREEFISTGTIHIVALSGYNITIIAENVMKIFSVVVSRMMATIFGITTIVLFIVMAGVSATSVRAGIMAIIMLIGRITGRTYLAGRALVIAGLLMVAYDPRVLSDMSFQLSFLATGGVLYITPYALRWFRFLPMWFGLRELTASTLSAMIAVLPLLLYSTGIVSVVALPANILILPMIPFAMFMSFLVGILSYLSPFIAIIFGYLAHLILSYILSVIHFFAELPFAHFTIQSFPLVVTIGLYVFMVWILFKKK